MKNTAILILSLMAAACDPRVVFTEPQPQGCRDLQRFPARYRGTYLERDDSAVYIVTAERILQKYEELLANPLDELLEEGDLELIENKLVLKDMNLSFPVSRRNDSIFGSLMIFDTVFDIRGEGKLRKLGRNYFLNLPSDSLWVVFKLNFNRSGKAYLCDIDHVRELELFRQYCRVDTATNLEGNPLKYLLSPTARELNKIVKLASFTDTTEYLRISRDY